MNATAAIVMLASLTGALPAQTVRPVEDDEAAAERRLAAESFRQSALEMTVAPSSAPGRAGRLCVLARFAARLAPNDGRVARLLADIYLAQARRPDEGKALEAYLAEFPADDALRRRWMDVRFGSLQSADKRVEFLAGLEARADLTAAIRAEAAALRARVLYSQGLSDEAVQAARGAIELAPDAPEAVTAWQDLEGDPSLAGRVTARLRMLRGDPRAASEAWAVALNLGALGLHEQALRFLEHARLADRAQPRPEALPEDMQVHYANALLDANQPAKATEALEAATGRFPRNAGLQALLIEACRAEGKEPKARQIIDAMAKAFEQRRDGGDVSKGLATERGWFYVDTDPQPSLAIIQANLAYKTDPNDPTCQRVLGAAEMAFGQAKEGEQRLRKLLGKDMYAAVLLAERYAAAKDADACKQAILEGAKGPRSGPAYRRLRALAKKQALALPPPEGADKAARMAEGFDDRYLQMVLKPQEFIAIELRPVAPTVPCGEAIELLATLRNIGPVDVPIGERGLLRPTLALSVTVGPPGEKALLTTSRLPRVFWPAPRNLPKGQAVEGRVRVDLADVARILARRPLEDLVVVVSATPDPTPSGASTVPSVAVGPAEVRRIGLLRQFDRTSPDAWREAYGLALGRIVRDLRHGALPARMQAARQTGALLEMMVDVGAATPPAPAPLAQTLSRPVMLSLARALLQDRSPAVRQEMIASLARAELDPLALSLLGSRIEDADPMARCRLVELLSGAQTRGCEAIVQLYRSDKDELVRAMAEAFGEP